jgi:hypothetical protein
MAITRTASTAALVLLSGLALVMSAGSSTGASVARDARPVPTARAARQHRFSYAWPVRPFGRQHPIRGYFGDPRIGMTPKGMQSTFHFGIDISAADGTPVYATLSGTVVRRSFRPETVALVAPDGHRSFEYWHLVPAVASGTQAVSGRTIVGYVGKGWGHVHFSELRDGRYLNPVRPAALGPYADPTAPVVRSLRVERNGEGVSRESVRGGVDLVAEAFDTTPLAVPKPWANRPVTPALMRWRVVGRAGAVTPWTTAVDFRLQIPSDDDYDRIYARWTRQNHPWSNGRYRLVLAHAWDSRSVAPGRYEIEVAASDTSGNVGSRRFPVRIAR